MSDQVSGIERWTGEAEGEAGDPRVVHLGGLELVHLTLLL